MALPVCPAPDWEPHSPTFSVPPLACDCHAHVFGPAEKYPYQASRSYTPHEVSVSQLGKLHAALRIERCVVVQASVYGTDNRAVLDAVAAQPHRLRAIAAVEADISDSDLEQLHHQGVRGIRVNLVDAGDMPFASLSALRDVSDRIRDLGWHIEFLVHVEQDPEFQKLVPRLSVPVSVGHVGYAEAPAGVDHPGFREFLALLGDGYCWVKLTGPAFPYSDVKPKAQAIVEAAPDRVVWGTDWPHVMAYRHMPNDGDLLNILQDWVPDQALRDRILAENPARLYGFDDAGGADRNSEAAHG